MIAKENKTFKKKNESHTHTTKHTKKMLAQRKTKDTQNMIAQHTRRHTQHLIAKVKIKHTNNRMLAKHRTKHTKR